MGRKKLEISENTDLKKIKAKLYTMIRTSKKIDGRSFQKYINQVAALKNKEQNRKQFMDLYDTINAIDQGESKGTFKKLGEVKAKKRAEEKVVENKQMTQQQKYKD